MIARRAYSDAAKDGRRQHILDAADRLLNEGRTLPTVAQIAEAAGLAKGTLYLYFGSREEIFAALLTDGWARLFDELEVKLAADTSKDNAIGAFVSSLATLVEHSPNLMFLDAMLTDFKRNLSEGARADFQATLHGRIAQAGDLLERALSLPPGRGFQLLVRSHAFARGLWQSFDSPDPLCQTPGSVMSLFSRELHEALTEYWRGAVA